MKTILCTLSLLLALTSSAQATENVNTVTCIYMRTEGSWWLQIVGSYLQEFKLAKGEEKPNYSGWTADQASPQHAVCTTLVGDEKNDTLLVRKEKFEARLIHYVGENCNVYGEDLVERKETVSLGRGEHTALQSPWMQSPNPEELKILVYFPRVEELKDLQQNTEKICEGLSSTL